MSRVSKYSFLPPDGFSPREADVWLHFLFFGAGTYFVLCLCAFKALSANLEGGERARLSAGRFVARICVLFRQETHKAPLQHLPQHFGLVASHSSAPQQVGPLRPRHAWSQSPHARPLYRRIHIHALSHYSKKPRKPNGRRLPSETPLMAHLACTCAAWPSAPCSRAPACRAQLASPTSLSLHTTGPQAAPQAAPPPRCRTGTG